jgi:hypothetical protein
MAAYAELRRTQLNVVEPKACKGAEKNPRSKGENQHKLNSHMTQINEFISSPAVGHHKKNMAAKNDKYFAV